MSYELVPAGLIEKSGPLDEVVVPICAARAHIGNETRLLNIAAACGWQAIGVFAQTEPLDYSTNIISVALLDGRFSKAGAIGRITREQAL